MAIEIERKFLVKNNQWRQNAIGHRIIQGYLPTQKNIAIRVRIAKEKAQINIKSKLSDIKRNEFEYPVPLNDAYEILNQLCVKPVIEKIRYVINYNGFKWEIDEFFGENEGLIIAELELTDIKQSFPKPDWLGKEVSGDDRYLNVMLVKEPYKSWK